MTNMKGQKLDVCGGVRDGGTGAPFPDQVRSHDVGEPTNSFNVTHKDDGCFLSKNVKTASNNHHLVPSLCVKCAETSFCALLSSR